MHVLKFAIHRRHPAVMTQAPKIFVYIAQALETESLSGQAARKVVEATQTLIRETGTDPAPLLQQFSPEAQQTIQQYFA